MHISQCEWMGAVMSTPSLEWGGRRWCMMSGKSLLPHALLLTAQSTQAASWVGGNGNSSNGKHLLIPRTDCTHSGSTCWRQIKPARVTQPLLNHVARSSFQKAATAHSKETLCVLLTLLSGGAGMAKGTCQTEVLLGFKWPWEEKLILLSTLKGPPGNCFLPKTFFLLTLSYGFCPGVRMAHTFTLRVVFRDLVALKVYIVCIK